MGVVCYSQRSCICTHWYAAADAAKEAAYVKNILSEMCITVPRTTPLKCDNQSTIKQSINQVDLRRCRHLGMRTHYLRQQYHAGHLQLQYVPSNDQKGDIFTKVLHTPQHEALRKSLNCMTIQEFRSRYNQSGLNPSRPPNRQKMCLTATVRDSIIINFHL